MGEEGEDLTVEANSFPEDSSWGREEERGGARLSYLRPSPVHVMEHEPAQVPGGRVMGMGEGERERCEGGGGEGEKRRRTFTNEDFS